MVCRGPCWVDEFTYEPTAQQSDVLTHATPASWSLPPVSGLVTTDHPLPVLCPMRVKLRLKFDARPTVQQSVALLHATPVRTSGPT
jgi:hypothetical protein